MIYFDSWSRFHDSLDTLATETCDSKVSGSFSWFHHVIGSAGLKLSPTMDGVFGNRYMLFYPKYKTNMMSNYIIV